MCWGAGQRAISGGVFTEVFCVVHVWGSVMLPESIFSGLLCGSTRTDVIIRCPNKHWISADDLFKTFITEAHHLCYLQSADVSFQTS